jgi:hypothetical protein
MYNGPAVLSLVSVADWRMNLQNAWGAIAHMHIRLTLLPLQGPKLFVFGLRIRSSLNPVCDLGSVKMSRTREKGLLNAAGKAAFICIKY